MGVSTQRLLIIVLAINLLMSLSYAIYEAPDLIDYGLLGETIDLGRSSASTFEGETSSVSPENLQEEGSFGSSLRMGAVIFNLFARGLVAGPYTIDTYSDPLTKLFVSVFNLFRALFMIILLLEVVMFYKSKKTS